ncbi:MAG: hypothetical protein KJ950_14085 [Proteobacteria bacterium]|nr:hypothetical protein [Pseudomonadota bacterium]MBU1686670.1 hypothetical protein [Pseudomonadota bacterium]
MYKNAIKATILSGLVLPGLGQLVLTRYIRGALMAMTSLVCMIVLVTEGIGQATVIVSQLLAENRMITQTTIMDAYNSMSFFDSPKLQTVTVLLMICWIISAVDAYLVGRQVDLAEMNEFQETDQ